MNNKPAFARVLKINREIIEKLVMEEHIRHIEQLKELQIKNDMQIFEDLEENNQNPLSKRLHEVRNASPPPKAILLKNSFVRPGQKELHKVLSSDPESAEIGTKENNLSSRRMSNPQPRLNVTASLVFKQNQLPIEAEKFNPDIKKMQASIGMRMFADFNDEPTLSRNGSLSNHLHHPHLAEGFARSNSNDNFQNTPVRIPPIKIRSQSNSRNPQSEQSISQLYDDIQFLKTQREVEANEFHRSRCNSSLLQKDGDKILRPSARAIYYMDNSVSDNRESIKNNKFNNTSQNYAIRKDYFSLKSVSSHKSFSNQHSMCRTDRSIEKARISPSPNKHANEESPKGGFFLNSGSAEKSRSLKQSDNFFQRYAKARKDLLNEKQSNQVIDTLDTQYSTRLLDPASKYHEECESAAKLAFKRISDKQSLEPKILALRLDESKNIQKSKVSVSRAQILKSRDGNSARKKIFDSILV